MLATASCELNIAFYPPSYTDLDLTKTFASINASVYQQLATDTSSNSSVAIQIGSSDKTLWSMYYNTGSPQDAPDGSKAFRIASNTKLFTALAILQLHAAGEIELDRSIARYLPNVISQGDNKIQWDKISIRSLLTHLSGIPDNYASQDILFLGGQALLDLPTVSNSTIAALPACEQNISIPCTSDGMISYLQQTEYVFKPNTESSYSNVGFDLLGLVISAVSGKSYEDYIETKILNPLNMTDTTFNTPSTSASVIPDGESAYGQDWGSDNPSGGLYSSADDMTKFLQYCLLHHNDISPTINWFEPQTYSAGAHSFFGMPWEIFRTTNVLKDNNRPTTFITKGGGLLGYYSYTVVIPDYDLTLVILLAGNVASVTTLLDTITVPLVRDIDAITQQDLIDTYTGTFIGTSDVGSNVSLVLSHSVPRTLYLSNLTVNGDDVAASLQTFAASQGGFSANDVFYQIIPTFRVITENQENQNMTGEVWRMINALDVPSTSENDAQIWNDYCVSNVDPFSYVGQPLNEIVFWKDGDANVTHVELPAWQTTLSRS